MTDKEEQVPVALELSTYLRKWLSEITFVIPACFWRESSHTQQCSFSRVWIPARSMRE